jgi:integrase
MDAEIAAKIRQKHITSPTFEILADTYYESRKNEIQPSTADSLSIKIEIILVPILGDFQVHDLSFKKLDDFCAFRRKQGVKNRTIRDDLTYIQAILNFAVSRSVIEVNPVKGYPPPRDDAEAVRPPNREEFEAIMSCAAPHIQRAMWIAYFTGCRPGPIELYSLEWKAVDFFRNIITITSAKKGGVQLRDLHLTDRFKGMLKQWYDEDILAQEKKGLKLKYIVHYHGGMVKSIKSGWAAAKRRAGITRRIRRYDLRHMTATELLAAGVDIVTIAEILGNTVEQCSNAYLHVSNDRKKNALDRL